MPHQLRKLIPNLIVRDLERSLAFYTEVLGFTVETTVPETRPFAFAIVRSGDVAIYLNTIDPAVQEYPILKDRPIGGSLTLYIEVDGIRSWHETLAERVDVVLPLETKWYGITEFAFTDPDGYVITVGQPEPPSASA